MPRTVSIRAVVAALCGLALLAAACELEEGAAPEPELSPGETDPGESEGDSGDTDTTDDTTPPSSTTSSTTSTSTTSTSTTSTTSTTTTVSTTTTSPPDPVDPPPTMAGMPHVNTDLIPTGSAGHSTVRVRSRDDALGQVGGGDDGAFRNVCDFSHMNFDDPLVFPGARNATHLHAFFGNTDIDYRSTNESIATTGNSTCRGGIINRSAYWVPAIIDTRDGRPITPSVLSVYYKSGWSHAPEEIQAHPTGLRMIAGDPRSGARQHNVWYACGSGGRTQGHIPPGCPSGEDVIMTVSFPQCWNGRDLDSADHRSHVAYPNGQCPDSHPVPLPHITFNVEFPVHNGDDTGSWRLSSDMYSSDQPGGYSGHADWWDGWMPEFRDEWTEHCTTKYVSCHSHLLGPGREIY